MATFDTQSAANLEVDDSWYGEIEFTLNINIWLTDTKTTSLPTGNNINYKMYSDLVKWAN